VVHLKERWVDTNVKRGQYFFITFEREDELIDR
jgi:hypothetical protein